MAERSPEPTVLARYEGAALCSAPEAMLKGLLEAEVPIALIAGPRDGAFAPMHRAAQDEAAAEVLRTHEVRVVATPTAARAVTLAHYAAASGLGAVALVPNEQLARVGSALGRVGALPERGGALCIVLEDRPADDPRAGTHVSKHAFGRALDISVQGIENEELLALCHKLPYVGCGYYPNGKFVHVDIRFGGSGLWVDVSAPGTPSRYVNDWPGVVENGRVMWKKPKR